VRGQDDPLVTQFRIGPSQDGTHVVAKHNLGGRSEAMNRLLEPPIEQRFEPQSLEGLNQVARRFAAAVSAATLVFLTGQNANVFRQYRLIGNSCNRFIGPALSFRYDRGTRHDQASRQQPDDAHTPHVTARR
jgi:hypothetical protein